MKYLATEIIAKTRNGQELTEDQISDFIGAYVAEELPDYQMAAWLMAALIKKLTPQEAYWLTNTMLHSGEVIDFSDIAKPKIDKHSTGGVGDKTSLILAPIVACADIAVPMMSGRGLGHSGGTLDKLDAIPGFTTQLDLHRFRKLIEDHGMAMIGQTPTICPADKKIYALRDVTATVESKELICASIMSKKLAEGIDSLVLDVKFGSGAFMKTLSDAKDLAERLIDIGVRGGKRVCALISNMDQPLGRNVGNALEIEECVSILRCDGGADMLYADNYQLSLELAGTMIFLGNKADSVEEGVDIATSILHSGQAYEKFLEICKAQGGDIDALPKAQHQREVRIDQSGYIAEMNTEEIGRAGIEIGAGRKYSTDTIDPTAGFVFHSKLGDKVEPSKPILTMYANSTSAFDVAEKRIVNGIKVQKSKPQQPPLIAARIEGGH
jgi:pyrimidine-nucleoside phosphorylase